MANLLPLLPHHAPHDVVAWHNGEAISAARFISEVERLRRRLPARSYVLNLCESRYNFLLGFIAALLSDQVSLLPPNRASRTCAQMREQYPDIYCLVDSEPPSDFTCVAVEPADVAAATEMQTLPGIPADRVAAIVFTSGTTGQPQPNPKTWASLVHIARATASRFHLEPDDHVISLATVPPQHMYGMEASIMLALQNGGVVHGARPFFPEDVRAAIAACSSPPILVTTPVHIRACVDAGLQFPAVRFVLSATAPLERALAAAAEKVFAAPVAEIYGCTEAGTMATRRTVISDMWELIEGLHVDVRGENAIATGDYLPGPVTLSDYVERQPNGQLRLLGRKADLINIAGKRMSLADLNQKLLQISGVIDGVFVVPPASDDVVVRLAALVVAPGLTEQHVMAQLRERLDPLFLPRPLYLVERLPRNAMGKLTREELSRVIMQCAKVAAGGAA